MLILASGSPRRKWLLREAGYRFRVVKPDVPEVPKKGELPGALVRRLSRDKAQAVAQALRPHVGRRVVIAADTIVVDPSGRHILGKPRNRRDAIRMLKLISGRVHTVLTGYTLLVLENSKIGGIRTRVVTTRVEMRALNDEGVRRYLARGESFDKAGAYAAQGHGMSLIRAVKGSFTNVVGLPLAEVLEDLRALGIDP